MESAAKKAKVSPYLAHHNIEAWYQENRDLFDPPVCNKLMHKDQLNVMFVGGPNTRTDFHIELGSEFFFQFKGNMELPTVQQGKRKLVKINEGQVFCLPARIPHSPQRPMEGSLGLVVERSREQTELDGLRWYSDFEKCDEILWEHFFQCSDLGKDLVPVVKTFWASEEAKTLKPGDKVVPPAELPFPVDVTTDVPAPFMFADFLAEHAKELEGGASLNLFGDDHPDTEFSVLVESGPATAPARSAPGLDYWLFQYKGDATVVSEGETLELKEGCSVVVAKGKSFEVTREPGSVGLVVLQTPKPPPASA